MSESLSYSLGFIVGIIFGVGLVTLIFVLIKKDKKFKNKYDERQIAAQGQAYKIGFFTMLVLLGLGVVLSTFEIELPIDNSFVYFMMAAISLCVTSTILIIKDAYYSFNDKSTSIKITFTILGMINLLCGIINLNNGKANLGGINLVCGAMLIYIVVILVIKDLIDKKEEEYEES